MGRYALTIFLDGHTLILCGLAGGKGMGKGKLMVEALYLLAFVVAWFALNRWILPRLGVPT